MKKIEVAGQKKVNYANYKQKQDVTEQTEVHR